MRFTSSQDCRAIENESPWQQRPLPATLYQFLRRTAETLPERAALSYQLLSAPKSKAITLTWRELLAQTTRAANQFRALGITENETIAFVLPNSPETVMTLLGGAVAGIVAPINPLLGAEQIAGILRETDARVVVSLRAFPKTDLAQKVATALGQAPRVHTLLEVDLNPYLAPPKRWIVPWVRPKVAHAHSAKVLDFAAAVAGQSETLQFDDSPGDRIAARFHTGGTTGAPKIVQHRYGGLVYNGWVVHQLMLNEDDSIMCPMPLFHVFAAHVALMGAISAGAHLVLPTPAGYRGEGVFDNFWKLIERWQSTFFITVPTALAALMQRQVDADISSIKEAFSGAAPMPVDVFSRFKDTSGVSITEGYGMTEATCIIACNPVSGEKKIGSVGVPLPYTELCIVKPAPEAGGFAPCAANEVGEICVHNPGVHEQTYMQAHLNQGLLYQGKYLRTGDLGYLDTDGYLWITGRAKDLIIRGGHNIDPGDIEDALQSHPAVAMAAAIGQPDAYAGEIPCAFVELVQSAEVSPEALVQHCQVHLQEQAAHPKRVEILPELPKTAIGKVFKPALRQRAITYVYNDTLQKAGIGAEVAEVIEDPKRGFVVQLARRRSANEEEVKALLGSFTHPWEWLPGPPYDIRF